MINRFALIKYQLKLLISELLSDPPDVVAIFIWHSIAASRIATVSVVMSKLTAYSCFIVEIMTNDDLSTIFFDKGQHIHAPPGPI